MTPKSMFELLNKVNKQIRVEEALRGRNVSSLSTLLPSSKRQGNDNASPDHDRGGKKNREKAGPSGDKPK